MQTATIKQQQNIITTEGTSNKTYQSISDLLQDEQMFRLDQDPVFDLNNNSEDLSSNYNWPTMDINELLSEDYISKPEDIEMFQILGFDDNMKKEEETIKRATPSPTVIIPAHTASSQQVVQKQQQNPVPRKMPVQRQESIKLEDDKEFDLISFITSNEVNYYNVMCFYDF